MTVMPQRRGVLKINRANMHACISTPRPASVSKSDQPDWPDIAEALDVLGAAADLSAFAAQHNKLQQLFKDQHASIATAPFNLQLLTTLTHVVSSGLYLAHQTSSQRLQQVPPAAAGCLLSCIETYSRLIKQMIRDTTKAEPLLWQLRIDIAESGLLQAMASAATKLKTAAHDISLRTSSAAPVTAEISSNFEPKSVNAAANNIGTAACHQLQDFSDRTEQSGGNSAAAAAGRASEADVQPTSATAEKPCCKLSTAAAHPSGHAAPAPNGWPAAGAAAACAVAGGADYGGKVLTAAAVVVVDTHSTLSQGLLLLYPHILMALCDAAAPNANSKHLPAVTVAISGLAVALLQLHGNTAQAAAAAATTPVTAAPAAGSGRASSASATPSNLNHNEWQSDSHLLACISLFAEVMLRADQACLSGLGGGNPAGAHESHLSEDVMQLALWVAASAADVLQLQGCSSFVPAQTAESPPAAASTQPASCTATPGSLGADCSHTSSSMIHNPRSSEAVIQQLPWNCQALVCDGQAQQMLLFSLTFLLEALMYRREAVPPGAAAPYGVHPSGSPGLHPCKVLEPQLVAPLMVMVIDVFVSQPTSPQQYVVCTGLIVALGNVMWCQAPLVPAARAAEAYVTIVRPLVCRLLPHMQQMLNDSPVTDLKLAPAGVQQYFRAIVIQTLQIAGSTAFPDSVILELANVFCDQPRLTAEALESALRSEAHLRPEELRNGALVVAVMRLVMHALYGTPSAQGSSAFSSDSNGTATAAAAVATANLDTVKGCNVNLVTSAAADPKLARQVFALIATCLKCTYLCSNDNSRPMLSALAAAAAAVSLSGKDDLAVLKYFDFAKDQKSFVFWIVHDSTEQTASNANSNVAAAAVTKDLAADLAPAAATAAEATDAAPLTPWLALAGRSLYIIGTLCKRSFWHEVARLDGQPASSVLRKLVTIVSVTFFCKNLVQWLGNHVPELDLQGEAAAAQKALQDLLSELQELHTILKAITSRMGPALKTEDHSTALACAQEFLSGPAQRMQQFGALVCAVLPVSTCCANPACQNVSKSSEMLSKCSGCKVVRYCGVNCQRQHWKQHRPVCAGLKASHCDKYFWL